METNLDPLGILKHEKISEQGSVQENARVQNIHSGVCPVCQASMKISKINISSKDIDAYICEKDRICMPIQNQPILDLY